MSRDWTRTKWCKSTSWSEMGRSILSGELSGTVGWSNKRGGDGLGYRSGPKAMPGPCEWIEAKWNLFFFLSTCNKRLAGDFVNRKAARVSSTGMELVQTRQPQNKSSGRDAFLLLSSQLSPFFSRQNRRSDFHALT